MAKCSLRKVWMSTIPSARRRVSRPSRHLCVLRTMEGARVFIVVVMNAIVSMDLEYRIRIYLLIVV